MASRDENDLDQKFLPYCVEFLCRANAAGLRVIIDCTYRSNEEQDALYAQGRTEPGEIVTHARGGQSAHNYCIGDTPAARAFDIAIYENETGELLDWSPNSIHWKMAHQIGLDLGMVLGADWPAPLTDPPHFEFPNWRVP